jgi:hypothetical protein
MVNVRLLLNGSDASYNETTKQYTFSLDRRIHRPRTLRIRKCHYSNASGATHPLVVYLESNALSALVPKKHTLRLRSANHTHQTNVLATLQETHTIGRYDLQNDQRLFQTDPDRNVMQIDIAFSNNGVLLPKSAAAGTNATGSDAEVLAIGDDLLAFVDFAAARTLNQSFAPVDQPGDTVYYLYNRGPNSELIFQNNYGAGTQLAAIGQHRGITRQGSWESVIDTWPVDLNDVNSQFCVHSLFKLSTLDWTVLFDTGYMKIYIWGQQLAYENAAGTKIGVLSVIPHVDYLLTIQRIEVDQANTNFDWRLERLDDNTVQTALSGSGLTAPPNANGFPWKWGASNTHFQQVQSCWILHNGLDAGHQATCQQWIKNTHAGTTTASSSGSESTTQDAQWFLELEITSET